MDENNNNQSAREEPENNKKKDENQGLLFDRLRKQRESKKIELQEIADKTHININYLRAIEEGNLDAIPDVYDKLFFNTYLDYIEPDNRDEIFEEFKSLRKEKKPKYTTTIRRVKSINRDPQKLKLMHRLYIIIPIVLVLVILGILAINTLRVQSDESSEIDEISARDIVEELESNDEPKESTQIPIESNDEKQEVVQEQVDVTLIGIDTSWVRYVKDRADTSEYLMRQNDRVNLQADSTMHFIVGNAAGINFTINGESIGVLGSKNQVISNLKITKEGIADKRFKNTVEGEGRE
ncbi:MAG: DUF4115 domain-containing protein [Caldithrix sp.]|nr:DUF4115 domain-containing protein [Caldithrix sp.]